MANTVLMASLVTFLKASECHLGGLHHAGSSSSSAGGGAKKAEQMTDEELKAALPSMLFTTSNLIWSSEWLQHVHSYHIPIFIACLVLWLQWTINRVAVFMCGRRN